MEVLFEKRAVRKEKIKVENTQIYSVSGKLTDFCLMVSLCGIMC